MAPGFDDDDRLQAGGRARGRHEFARAGDRLDVKQDRARAAVERQPIQHVAEIDVRHVAQRHQMREPDLARARPIQNGRGHGARLRDERKVALGRGQMREGRVEPGAGNQQAQAIGPDDAHQMRPCRVEHRVFQRLAFLARQFAEARRDHDGGFAAARAQIADGAGHGRRRGADHGEIRDLRQGRDVRVGEDALDRAVFGIDRQNGAGEAPIEQIARQDVPDRPGLGRGADQGDGLGGEHPVEIADRHGSDSKCCNAA